MLLLFFYLLNASSFVFPLSKVYLSAGGGYRKIVVNIEEEIGEANCKEIVYNLKVVYQK